MFELLKFEIKGLTQHVQHNGLLADVTNPYAVAMKEITKKKTKTADDLKRLEDLEWEGGLYLNTDRRVVVPGNLIEGAMFEAGKLTKDGQVVRNSVSSPKDWPLIYQGPKTVDGLKADPNFRLRVIVRNPSTKARVARVRPVFREWALKFELLYRPDMLSAKEIADMVTRLGSDIGLSDDRKKMGGRFEVVKAEGPFKP